MVYIIDDCTNQWLSECRNAEMVMNNIHLFMDFRTLMA